MRIQTASAWRVYVPLLEEWASSPEFGPHKTGERVILRLVDEDGREGWGEGPWRTTENQLEESLKLLLGSHNPRTSFLDFLWKQGSQYWQHPLPPSAHTPPIENLRHRLRHPLQVAVETACLDLYAKRLNEPLNILFGGLWRNAVPTDYWMGRTTPEHAARCARRGKELGFHGIKLKTTLADPNVERLEAIKEAAGTDFHVTVDPNGRFYRIDDCKSLVTAMDSVGNMRILEDPFPRTSLADSAMLRSMIKARLVIHTDPPEILAEVLRSNCCGGLNMDSHTQGLFNWRMQAATADQFNLPVWHGSGLDCGIYTAAQLHLAASTPNCQLPGDQVGPWLGESSLIHEAFEVVNGCVKVPTGPGLGVTPDLDAIENYSLGLTEVQS